MQISQWQHFSLRKLLQDTRPWVRNMGVLLLCLLFALPVGSVLGLLGGLVGSAAILALVIGYLMLRSLIFGLVVLIGVIFLLPFAALPIDIGFSPTLLDLALVGVFFVWASRVAAHKEREFRALSPTFQVLIFMLLAVFSFIAGLAHAPLTANVVRRFAEILMAISLFVLIINVVRTPYQVRILTMAIILAGFVAAVIGVVLYMLPQELTVRLLSSLRVLGYPSGSDVLRFIEDDPSRPLRAISTSIDPNVLGGALIFATTITTTQIFAKAPVFPKRWLSLMSLAMVACLFLTYSRGSFLGLSVAILLLAFLRYRRLFWVILVCFVAILVLPVTQEYVAHFIRGIRGEDLATQMRFGEYKDALTLIRRYPWFGVGFAGTPDVDIYLGVSNVYLLIAENMGLIGLTGFLSILFSFLWRFIKALLLPRTRPLVSPTSLGFFLAMVGAMVGGLVDHYLFNLSFPHAASLFWLTLGLGIVSLHMDLTVPGALERFPDLPLWQQFLSPDQLPLSMRKNLDTIMHR